MQLAVRFLLSIAVLLPIAGAVSPSGEPNVAGRWEGAILVRPGEYEIDLLLTLEPCQTGLCGRLSLPTDDTGPLDVKDVEIQGSTLSFQTRDREGTVSNFQGTLSSDGRSIEGTLAEGQQLAPFSLSRAPEPASSPAAVATLSGQGEELREAFNQDHDKVRLLMILSSSCSNCRMSARLVQRYVLETLEDSRLAVYVVWEKIGPKDSPESARQSAALLPDPRVRFFWSEERAAGKAFQEPVGIQGTPAWDVFLVFRAGKSWAENSPPAPDFFMHNQFGHPELPKDQLLNANRLAEKVKSYLADRS